MQITSLITGAAGFIGSHLAQRLAKRGDRLILIDDLSTGRQQNLANLPPPPHPHTHTTPHSPAHAPHLWRHGRVADVLQREPQLMQSVDAVYHLAATVGVKLVIEHPVEAIRNNIEQTAVVLEIAAQHGVTVLIASSSEVYGKTQRVPMAEDQPLEIGPTTSPRWAYAHTKALDEHMALAYHASARMPTVVARLFNTIGPRQVGDYGMVVPRFVHHAVHNLPLEIYGDGNQSRCFCDVRDTVEALIKLVTLEACHGHVFNVGNDQSITINDLADRIITRADSRSTKTHIPYNQTYPHNFDDLMRRAPSLKKILAITGFFATITLDQTLDDLIDLERAASN